MEALQLGRSTTEKNFKINKKKLSCNGIFMCIKSLCGRHVKMKGKINQLKN